MRTAFMIALGVISILLTVVVLLQSTDGQGLSSTIAGAGASEGYKKKKKGLDELLTKLTIVFGIIFVVLTVVLLIIK